MKWGYATTAAILRSLQKDLFYRRQLQNELKMILLDHLPVGWIMRIEDDWLPLVVDLFYYTIFTGNGNRTLGESYSHLMPVDLTSRRLLLKNKLKRILWVIAMILVPFAIKKRAGKEVRNVIELMEPVNSILFYASGKFPNIVNNLLSIRYIFYPRRPPIMDEDALVYKGLAAALTIITLTKLKEYANEPANPNPSNTTMKESSHKYKCPVCYDHLEGATFASINCGHVYCWYCISRWMATSEQTCPVCRIKCEGPDLIPLANLK